MTDRNDYADLDDLEFRRVLSANNTAYYPNVFMTKDEFLQKLHKYVTLCVVSKSIECGRTRVYLQAKADKRAIGFILKYFKEGIFSEFFFVKAVELIYMLGGRFADDKYVNSCIDDSISTLKWITQLKIHSFGYVYQRKHIYQIDWSVSGKISENADMLRQFLDDYCFSAKSITNIYLTATLGTYFNSAMMSLILSKSILEHFNDYEEDDTFKETALRRGIDLYEDVSKSMMSFLLDEALTKSIIDLMRWKDNLSGIYFNCLIKDIADLLFIIRKCDAVQEIFSGRIDSLERNVRDNEYIFDALIDSVEDINYETKTIIELNNGRSDENG